MAEPFSLSKAYLLGLITGRGHFFLDSKSIAIEFSHANEFVAGIAHCTKCGWLATDDKKGGLKCKNPKCGHPVDPSVKKVYDQPKSTVESLKAEIIPFLQSGIKADFDITGNKSMTILVIDFKKDRALFDEIVSYFSPDTSFDRFHIPRIIFTTNEEAKREFINGLLDTSGFANAGGWLNRDGENGHGRMRVYFQIVRNWHLPVEIDNFIRSEFDLPIHTIDWGHPNIRDGNLKDFFETNPTSWGREHQIKFFPEYYLGFRFRITSKQAMFDELRDHNAKAVFKERDDWFPPSKVTKGKIKAYHPGEKDLRIPEPARRHFDAFWQINLATGCKFLKDLQAKAKNPVTFALTGDLESAEDPAKIESDFDVIRKTLTEEATKRQPAEKAPSKRRKTEKELAEQAMYQPLTVFFAEYLSAKYSEPADTFDTSAGNLNLFLKNKNRELLDVFDYCDKYRIRPDVVGFLEKQKALGFIEAKITPLDLKSLGQLMGYCLVAQPIEAILVSTKAPSLSLIKVLKARPDLLTYAPDRRIQIATLENGNVNFIAI
ncbi:hypothetical protein IPJ70_04345 [Candidatus Campbellbacteria bacterium]|nr:MAG: hypothetical protein IPJ70_04345 [Candidatus Campbellbacteria bacterium]